MQLSYWELTWGGLLHMRSHDGVIHHVRQVGHGTPGPTICGIDRFAKGGPGGRWSRTPDGLPLCPDCADVAWEVLGERQ